MAYQKWTTGKQVLYESILISNRSCAYANVRGYVNDYTTFLWWHEVMKHCYTMYVLFCSYQEQNGLFWSLDLEMQLTKTIRTSTSGIAQIRTGQNVFYLSVTCTLTLTCCKDNTSFNGNYFWTFHDDTMKEILSMGRGRQTAAMTDGQGRS